MTDLAKLFMPVIEILLYFIILFSKMNSTNKLVSIIGIFICKLFNGALNTFLKFKFKVKLSNKILLRDKIKRGLSNIYSMPSGHAQYISFFIIIIYLFYTNSNNIGSNSNKHLYLLLISSIFIYIYCFLIEYIIGSVIGGFVGFITYIIISRLLADL